MKVDQYNQNVELKKGGSRRVREGECRKRCDRRGKGKRKKGA